VIALFKELVDFLDSVRTCPTSKEISFEISGKGSMFEIKKALLHEFSRDSVRKSPKYFQPVLQ